MKKIIALIFAVLMCFGAVSCGSDTVETESENTTAYTQTENQTTKEATYPKVKITVKNYGVIKLKLDDSQAPVTVEHFIYLVNKGFYDGLTFHRIMDNFMIQGGDPLGNGTGGYSENGQEVNILGEFSQNGVNNTLSHTRGVISMARSQDNNSASSQFFICNVDSTFLDGSYAAFGAVYEGMDVVDKITEDIAPKATDDNGTISAEDQPIIEKIEVIK